ncbi:adenosylcobinamide-phosphate synthase CbiB [Halanaerobium hydrogeniformans]|uniref:Cobalamin biosynthesis protein CobD n=1 Tax=Halanaerobium hydrogeniformans TaxID=656519 RepID=E4RK35_HALHG|nr:adenosylcobinamide-phosphate synthase CbiB [Halanaerobium hydrogeniformans]ADQ15605.1 cobalamin biosynthesis protein CobD [Halanaerobium hydrogeniformans]
MGSIYLLIAALIIDLIISDPSFLPHPVVLIGNLIKFLENKLRKNNQSKKTQKIWGLILVIIVITSSYIITALIIRGALFLNYYFAYIVNLLLLSSCLALKGLVDSGKKVYSALKEDDLKTARKKVNMIVGRDCSSSSREDVIRAALESLAENTSDGIIAPMFFYLIGGTPLAVSYKAVNTLDSMLGYKNEKYINFGRAAAKLDDLFNYFPARITGFSFIAASIIFAYDFRAAFKIMRRDAGKHPSPNAGYPEAAAAGALSLRFGGYNYYQGEQSFRAYLGDKIKEFEINDILRMNKLIYFSVLIFIAVSAIVKTGIQLLIL